MMITAETTQEKLPSDVETLQWMVLNLLADVDDKAKTIVDLQGQLDYLKRHLFGRKSERLNPEQRLLFENLIPQLEQKVQQQKQTEAKTKSSNRNGRRPLPEDLPRDIIEHHPPKDELTCEVCHSPKTIIGQKVTEQLDYLPASFIVRQHIRHKYACKQCQGNISIAPLPAFPIERGLPGSGLLSHIITSKYSDHLPLNRLEEILSRHGVDINKSTMCDWVSACSDLLEPIVKTMKLKVLQSAKIHTDDTAVPVQNKKRRSTYNGYLWTYIGDSGNVVFDFTPNRSREGPIRFLGDYQGYVQADAYSGYDEFFRKGDAIEVGCWAHTRRKFYDAKETDPLRAEHMLALIGELYAVERQAKEEAYLPEQLLNARQTKSRDTLGRIKALLDVWVVEVLPKSPIGKAVTYALNQWNALMRYIDDPILDIDNNVAERALRRVVIGRKNWLFAGSENGARRAAIIYSLVASCKMNDLDPFAYFKDVLDRVSTHPASQVDELLPCNWQEPAES